MPLLVGIPGSLLCLWQLAVEIKSSAESEPLLLPQERATACWLLGFIAAIALFGFSWGTPPLVAAYLYYAAK